MGQTSIDDFVKDDLEIFITKVLMKLTNYFDAKCTVTKTSKIILIARGYKGAAECANDECDYQMINMFEVYKV